MSWVAVWDRVVPVGAVIAAGVLAYFYGRAVERLDWLTGRRTTTPQNTAPAGPRTGVRRG